MKSKVVVRPVPQQNGTPLQPGAKMIGQLSNVIGLTVMQGARAYTERQRVDEIQAQAAGGEKKYQVTPGKLAEAWPVPEAPERYKSTLLVGRDLWETSGMAAQLFSNWEAIERVSTVLCAEQAGSSTRTVEQFLSALGATRDAIEIEGTELVVQLGTSRQPWEIKEETGVLQTPRGVQGLLVWTRMGAEGLCEVHERGLGPVPPPTVWKVGCKLDLRRLMNPEDRHIRVEAWARKEAWKQCGVKVPSCAARQPPPMSVVTRGAQIEVEIPLRIEEAVILLKTTGATAGVEFRPWYLPDMPDALQARIHWIKEDKPLTGLAIQTRYAKLRSLPWFRGVVVGDVPTRYGVRAAGMDLDPEHRAEACRALGMEYSPPRAMIQVQGHGPEFDLRAAQEEAKEVFGTGTEVTVTDLKHRAGTSVDRPVYDLVVEGVPGSWVGHSLITLDPSCRPRVWRRRVVVHTSPPRRQVNTKTRLDLDKLREAEEKEAARRAEMQRLAEEKEAEEAQDKAEEDANMQDMGGADPELL